MSAEMRSEPYLVIVVLHKDGGQGVEGPVPSVRPVPTQTVDIDLNTKVDNRLH